MPFASVCPVFKSALVTRLEARPALNAVNVLPYIPVNQDDIRTDTGAFEVIAMAEAAGPIDVNVFGGRLRFDEDTLTLTVLIEVHGTDSSSTQTVVDARVNELLYEILADISDQQNWDKATLGLDIFDYIYFVPVSQQWTPGRLQQSGVFAAACELGIAIRARRSFS